VEEINIIREGAIPLHAQLLNQLRHLILSGKWAADARIPSETALQRQLNISRSTIRQALSNAEVEGLVTRVPGKGTFVSPTISARRSSRLIGYVTDDCCSRMQSRVLTGVQDVAAANGYRVLFGHSNASVASEDLLLDQLVFEDQVAGILIWPVMRDGPSGRLAELAGQGIMPVVVVDRTIDGLSSDFVTSENYLGARYAVRHLLELGHREIAFLSRPILFLSTIAERLRGYQDAMQSAGVQPLEPMLVGHAIEELGTRSMLRDSGAALEHDIDAIAEHLDSAERPSAIFAANDIMAIQAMKVARMLGLSVPTDLSIVGFDDDVFLTSLLDVSLTTVAQDAQRMGQRASEMLVERIQGYDGATREERLPVQLKVRDSTASPATLKLGAALDEAAGA
jgi:GntR family transcriptional regulator of arabinose operon